MPRMDVNNLMANLTSPQRVYLWEMVIPNPPGGGDVEALTVRCQSTVLPSSSHEEIHIDYKGTGGFNVPGRLRFPQTIDFTFVEGEDHKIFDCIYNWRNLITDYGTGIGTTDGKTDIYLTLLSTDGKENLKIKLVGAYPESHNEPALDYGTSDRLMLTVTFRYDYWVKVE